LTENVNRQEMHPLDEAASFKHMADNGAPIEEIARYYARSPSAIYKRLRLCGLIDELKVMCRDGNINITGAVLLAELPVEDQKNFYELYEKKENIDPIVIAQFIQKKQRYVIKNCMKNCEGCNKRTHNEGNDLFEEFKHLHDVCLDAECYRLKWYEMLEARMQEQLIQTREAGLQTDNKIFFLNGVPELIYKKASFVNIAGIDKQHEKFEILRTKDYEFTNETNRKKDTCWEIKEIFDGIIIRRVGYKERPPRVKSDTEEKSNVGRGYVTDVKDYGRDVMEAISKERGETAKDLANKLYSKNVSNHVFESDIKDIIFDRIIAKRIEAEKGGNDAADPPRDYLSMFLRLIGDDLYACIPLTEKDFNEKQKNWYRDLVGNKSISKIAVGLSEDALQLFHFLMLCIGFSRDVPDLEELKDINKENIFWEYAAMSKDEYRDMYLQAAKEVTANALDSKPKKNKKTKKIFAEDIKDDIPWETDGENYPFSPPEEGDEE